MPRDLIGETLLNQFRVETYLASGGMATIYRVWDLQRSVPLAMKVLHPELAADPAFIARFQREADSLQRLVHPHIVPFYGLFQASELTFMLERYIDGPSLDEVLRRRNGQPVGLGEGLVYFKALYTSLGYAHNQGIIHCDVKPGNVLIDQGGHVYLTDFGISRYMDSSNTTSSALGTPLYMAPEQIRGERVSPQTDIYSLGVVMFELLTGQRPFRGSGDIPAGVGPSPSDRIRYQHLTQNPPHPRTMNPQIPEGIAQVLLRAMAKRPQERYQNVQAMADEITQVVSARFESIPDRVRLPQDMRQAYDWTVPAQPEPVEAAPEAAEWPWDRAQPLDDRYPSPAEAPGGWAAPGWDAGPEPQATLPGPATGQPYGTGQQKRAFPMRWLVILASLALLVLCGVLGASALRSIAGGLLGLPSSPTQPAVALPPTDTVPPGEPTSTPPPTFTAEPTGEPSATQAPEPTATEVAPALADFPVPGQIAVIQKINGIDRLLLLNADSGEVSQLPGVPNVESDLHLSPQWSPDGQSIVWVSRYRGKLHVAVMDMGEMEPYQLPAGEAFDRISSPAWMPDGQRVTFYATGGGGTFLVTADGTTGEELERVQLPVYRNLFVWNWQNGQTAYVQQFGGQYGAVVSSSPLNAETQIESGGEEYAPAWSNDGQWLAFQSDAGREPGMNEIWISRGDGAEARQVTTTPDAFWSRAPTWSPNGRMIAFVSNRSGSIGNDYGELFVVNLETGETRQMTNTGGRVYDWRPAWRP